MAESVNIIIAKIEGNRNNVPKIFKNVAQILFFINISFYETNRPSCHIILIQFTLPEFIPAICIAYIYIFNIL